MTLTYIHDSSEANLSQYPSRDPVTLTATNITLGDLHGNPVKLLYFLIRNGIITMDPLRYRQFSRLYQNLDLNRRENLITVSEILLSINVINTDTLVRLLGDVLADRGHNDVVTLMVLNVLRDANVPVRILASNHDAEFIQAYEHNIKFDTPITQTRLRYEFSQSFYGMVDLLARGFLTESQLHCLVEAAYLPTLVLLDYTRESNQALTLFSHAPIDLDCLSMLAARFSVPFKLATLDEFCATLDAINVAFRRAVQEQDFHTLYHQSDLHANVELRPESSVAFAFWNRFTRDLDREDILLLDGTALIWVHGHHTPENGVVFDDSADSVICLDNGFGKTPASSDDVYTAVCSTGQPAAVPLPVSVNGSWIGDWITYLQGPGMRKSAQETAFTSILWSTIMAAFTGFITALYPRTRTSDNPTHSTKWDFLPFFSLSVCVSTLYILVSSAKSYYDNQDPPSSPRRYGGF